MDQTGSDTPVLSRSRMIQLVRRWGDVNSDALLDPSCQHFTAPDMEGFIGYRIAASNAVVYGEPVADNADKPLLASTFQKECMERGLGVVYMMSSGSFTEWALTHLDAVSFEFGIQFLFDPLHNPFDNTGEKAGLVRRKVKRALKEGVTAQEYLGGDTFIEEGIEGVTSDWLNRRQGIQIHISHLQLFSDRVGKRYIYAQREGKIVGILTLNEIRARSGWLLNHVMTTKNAPQGTSELLVTTALQIVAAENCRCVVAGPVPGKCLQSVRGIHPALVHPLKWLFRGIGLFCRLDRHIPFWDKFQPNTESSYVLFPKKNLTCRSLKALLRALNATRVENIRQ